MFGGDVVKSFVHNNDLDFIARAHQLILEGYKQMFDSTIVTVWSAPNYCYRCGNVASILQLDDALNQKYATFEAASQVYVDVIDAGSMECLPSGRRPIIFCNFIPCRDLCICLVSRTVLSPHRGGRLTTTPPWTPARNRYAPCANPRHLLPRNRLITRFTCQIPLTCTSRTPTCTSLPRMRLRRQSSIQFRRCARRRCVLAADAVP